MNKTYIKRNENSFASEEAITGMCRKVNYSAENWSGGSGINVISNGQVSYIHDTEASTMVVGATGSGKTRRVLLPYTYSCIKEGSSLIINDPKGEIYTHMYDILCKEEYKIIVLDYRNPLRGDRYNPLEHPARLYKQGNTSRAAELFTDISKTIFGAVKSEKDPFWPLTASQYFVGLAELVSENFDEKLCTLDNIFNIHIQGEDEIVIHDDGWGRKKEKRMKRFFETNDRKKKNYWKLLCPTVTAPNETRGGITAVFTSTLGDFVLNDNLIDQTSGSTFDIRDLVDSKTALFFITRDEGSVYDRLISTIINQIYQYLIDIAEEDGENGRLKRRIEFILDEFGNLPAIDMIQRKLTAGRSRNIRWLTVVQSLQQLILVYGKEVANIIIGNGAGNLVYMYSNDKELLDYISHLCGNNRNSYGVLGEPLLPISKLRSFDKMKGECLMLLERMSPFVGYLPDISAYPIKLSDKSSIGYRDKQKVQVVDFDSVLQEEVNEAITFDNRRKKNKEVFPGPSGEMMDIDKMIAEIDKKIAEIEAEEAAEKLAEETKNVAERIEKGVKKEREKMKKEESKTGKKRKNNKDKNKTEKNN